MLSPAARLSEDQTWKLDLDAVKRACWLGHDPLNKSLRGCETRSRWQVWKEVKKEEPYDLSFRVCLGSQSPGHNGI